ncbi:hypothetical protein JCM1841_002439, partial [Sporobolomyces salmonicolor]
PAAVVTVPEVRKRFFGWKPAERPPTSYPRALPCPALSSPLERGGSPEVLTKRLNDLSIGSPMITARGRLASPPALVFPSHPIPSRLASPRTATPRPPASARSISALGLFVWTVPARPREATEGYEDGWKLSA